MNFRAFLNTISTRAYSLPIVILYVTEGCNLQCITCSYRQALPNELTLQEIEELAQSLVGYGLKHIVYSGGEPLLRRDFPQICRIFSDLGVKQSMLTNGLLLEKRLPEIQDFFSEVIVSIDGPIEETHNAIRGIQSFNQIVKGLTRATQTSGFAPVSIRTVIQKRNFRQIMGMVEFAKSMNVRRISFLTADVLSKSFGRDRSGAMVPDESIMLDEGEVSEFRQIIEKMIAHYHGEIENRFVSESEAKLRRLVQYFEALLGEADFPMNTCNAPMVSAVITSTGEIQPCYFLPSYGNIRSNQIQTLANSAHIRGVRSDVRDYKLERCQTCVCTLYMRSGSALLDKS